MSKFIECLTDVMKDKGITIKDLENNNILSKNSFYLFVRSDPSLNTIIKLANFLKVSIDYLLDRSTTNNFHEYSLDQSKFYETLMKIIKDTNINKTKVCQDLNMSRTNFYRWKSGTEPSLSTLISLSNYLGCPIDDFLNKA